MKTELFRFEIPNYIREIKVSEKQRARYWVYDGNWLYDGQRRLLRYYYNNKANSHISEVLKDGYYLGYKLGKNYAKFEGYKVVEDLSFVVVLCKKENNKLIPVIANPTKVGTPKVEIIKGNRIYAGINEHTKTKMIDAIKEQVRQQLWTTVRRDLKEDEVLPLNKYPIIIDYELHDTVEDKNSTGWDLDNRMYLYRKCINDVLVSENIIEQDNILHITGGSETFVPILIENPHSNPKIVIIISSDDRPYIKGQLHEFERHRTRKIPEKI